MMLTSAHSGVRASCLRSIGVPNCAIASRNAGGASFWSRMHSTRLSCSTSSKAARVAGIGQAVEIEAAHRSGHVAAELLGLKTHGVTPGRHDNVRADQIKAQGGSR